MSKQQKPRPTKDFEPPFDNPNQGRSSSGAQIPKSKNPKPPKPKK